MTKISTLADTTYISPEDFIVAVDIAEGTSGTRKVTKNAALRMAAVATADDLYDGPTIAGLNAGETIAQWQPVYLDAETGEYLIADANAAGKYPARGLAVTTGSDGNPLNIFVFGVARNDGWAFGGGEATACRGQTLYLSTGAGVSTLAPSGSSDCIQVIGWVLSTGSGFFNFTGVYAVHT